MFDFAETNEFDYVDRRINDFSYTSVIATSSMDRIFDSYNEYRESQQWN